MKESVTQGRDFVSRSGKCLSTWFTDDNDQAAMDSVGNERRETHEMRKALSPRAQMEVWALNGQTDHGRLRSQEFCLFCSGYTLPLE